MPLISYFPSASAGNIDYSSYFGTGEDGDLIVDGDVALDVIEDQGQIIKQYNNVTINAGATLRPAHRCNGMILLVKGNLTVNGKISVAKCSPLLNPNETQALNEPHIKLCGNLTGGNGGKGGDGGNDGGTGGAGGNGHGLGGGYGGGGAGDGNYDGSLNTKGGDSEPRPPVGITWPCTTSGEYGAGGTGGMRRNSYPYGGKANGGASPGGSGGTYYVASFVEGDPHGAIPGLAGDAYGGGLLVIFVQGAVRIGSAGEIDADGGVGATISNDRYISSADYPGTGGSGGGGIIALVHTGDYINSGSIHANGGVAPSPPSKYSNRPQSVGNAGSIGSVLVTQISELF